MVKYKFSIESYYNELSQRAAEFNVDNYYRSFEYPFNTKRIIANSEDLFFSGAEWQRNNLWIPVSEYLSSFTIWDNNCYLKNVLIFNSNYVITIGYYNEILDKWFSSWDGFEVDGVTHWMPIPKINNI